MGYQNQVLFGSSPKRDDWSVIGKDICYASLFRSPWYYGEKPVEKKGNRYIYALYRFCDTRLARKDADAWLRFVLYHMPPRIRKAISIRRAWGKYHAAILKFYDLGQPWIRVVIDGSKVSATEAYAILAFLRYPQERDDVVSEWLQIQEDYNCNPSLAFLIAGAIDSHSGHGLITNQIHCELKGNTPDQLEHIRKTFSISLCWKRLIRGQGNQEPYEITQRKFEAAEFFVPIPGMVWDGWGGVEQFGRKQHPKLRTKTVCQMWASRFNIKPKKAK
jgi:hypothetical protein